MCEAVNQIRSEIVNVETRSLHRFHTSFHSDEVYYISFIHYIMNCIYCCIIGPYTVCLRGEFSFLKSGLIQYGIHFPLLCQDNQSFYVEMGKHVLAYQEKNSCII